MADPKPDADAKLGWIRGSGAANRRRHYRAVYVLLNPFRPFMMVNLPSRSTDALIQFPLQSAVSSKFAIMLSEVLCFGFLSNSERCPCQMPSIPGMLASLAYPLRSYGAVFLPAGVIDFTVLSTCPRPFRGPLLMTAT